MYITHNKTYTLWQPTFQLTGWIYPPNISSGLLYFRVTHFILMAKSIYLISSGLLYFRITHFSSYWPNLATFTGAKMDFWQRLRAFTMDMIDYSASNDTDHFVKKYVPEKPVVGAGNVLITAICEFKTSPRSYKGEMWQYECNCRMYPSL